MLIANQSSRSSQSLSSSSSSATSNHLGAGVSNVSHTTGWVSGNCFNNRLFVGRLLNVSNIIDLKKFFDEKLSAVNAKVIEYLTKHTLIKVSQGISLDYIIKKGDEEITDSFYFQISLEVYDKTTDFNVWYLECVHKFDNLLQEFEARGSGASLSKINHLELNIAKYDPLKGGSYIPLPKKIISKNACINIQNNDHFCFAHCITAYFYPARDKPSRLTNYPTNFMQLYNFSNINFPTPLTDIAKFEKNNPDISLNVYGLSESDSVVGPLYYTKQKRINHINLLLLEAADNFHYVLIKDLSRLCASQISNHQHRMIICDKCLQYFYIKTKYDSHLELCHALNTVKIKFPNKEESILKFKNHNRKEIIPFVVYADFECFTKKSTAANHTSNSSIYQNHTPYAVAYKVVCSYNNNLNTFRSFTGEKCAEWFINELRDLAKSVEDIYKNIVPMQLTEEDELVFNSSDKCHICEKIFLRDDVIVKDHDHLTGKFRGAACQSCNINYQLPNFIPIYFHNGSNYDFNLFIKELAYDEQEIRVIPLNNEKYISFSKRVGNIHLRFLDTCKFMHASLDSLVKTLSENQFELLEEEFGFNANLNLLKQKGIFPYDYVDDWAKLQENCLPSIENFYNKLTDSDITHEEYLHARNVWNAFGVDTMGGYTDIYLKTDVLLLACVFENYRKITLSSHGLDPAYYYTVPGLTFDAMLKVTKIELELIQDINILNFIENAIRGGLTLSVNRYAESNHKYMKNYNSELAESYILYLDANNLYGHAMSQPLPYKDFKFMSTHEVELFDVNTYSPDGEIGYFLEVDIEYPEHLHDDHNDFPFLPGHLEINKYRKLVSTFYPKKKYICHLKILQQALHNGLKLLKIHRILSFKQSLWLKKYIDLNTTLRTQATTEIAKQIYKDYNNCLYGKTIESVRKRRKCKLISKWDGKNGIRNLIASPFCKTFKIIAPNLVVVEHRISEILFDKPIYIGAAVLELSKHLMYNFHYGYAKKTFKNLSLLYTDTDSFVYHILRDPDEKDVYEVIARDIDLFDTSDYPLPNPFNIPQKNKKKIGLMKDELNGKFITKFCALRAKMYAFEIENSNEKKKGKGITKSCLKKISFNDYYNTLFENMINNYSYMYTIKNKDFKMYTIKQRKKTLSADDDKRFILPNKINTLALGHKDIK